MIETMSSISPYLVIERRHLREILEEQRLAATGLVDADRAVRSARLARAELFLHGSFAREGDQVTIQVRLIRVSDQRALALTAWVGGDADILSAPRTIAERLLNGTATPLDSRQARGIEHLFPTSVDEARSYYLGLRAFDDGRYAEALAHYPARHARRGPSARRTTAVLEMYNPARQKRARRPVCSRSGPLVRDEARSTGRRGVLRRGRTGIARAVERPAVGTNAAVEGPDAHRGARSRDW
jgi:hypothetical protein